LVVVGHKLVQNPKAARVINGPAAVVDRLPLYARCLALLQSRGQQVVSSSDLARLSRVTPAQIRKDLSYFGRFGKQGRGYNVGELLEELWRILGLDRQWRMALVGAGKVG
jgi:redox-sensing transcriptional repressor